MAVKIMKIQFRSGKEADLLADRILPGEPVYANDTNKVGIGTALGTIVWFATMNADGKVIQDPASYGQVGGAALISSLPQSPKLVMLNPDGTLSPFAPESGIWTPYFYGETTAGDIVYEVNKGYYTVIGNLCMVEIQLTIKTIIVQPTGNLKLGGWPKAEAHSPTIISIVGQLAGKSCTGIVAPSTENIRISNGHNYVPASTLVNGDFIQCTSCYICKP